MLNSIKFSANKPLPKNESTVHVISKPGEAVVEMPTKKGGFPNIWDKKSYYTYEPGNQVVMHYGQQPVDYIAHERVKKLSAQKGYTTFQDRAVGDKPTIMATYADENGTPLKDLHLKPGDKVSAHKIQIKSDAFFPKAGTLVETLETIAAKAPPVKLQPGQIVMTDVNNKPYINDIKTFIKRTMPVDPQDTKAAKVYDAAKGFVESRTALTKEFGENAAPKIAKHWDSFLEVVGKVAKAIK